MAEKKKPEVLEGEILSREGDDKTSTGKKHQYISEKAVGITVLIAVLLATGYFVYQPVKDWLSGGAEQTTSTPAMVEAEGPGIKDRVAALEEKTAQLEERAISEAVPENLEDRLGALEARITALEDRPITEGEPATIPDERLRSLETEIASLKEQVAKKAAEPVSVVSNTFAQAVAALATPLYQSLPFEGELERVRVLVLGMEPLDQAALSEPVTTLSDFSLSGIPNLESIREKFSLAAVEALKVEGLTEDSSWWDRTWARIKGLVVVRRTDGSGGTPLEDVIIVAENRLERGDVTGAIEIIASLPPTEAEAFNAWIALARDRTRAVQAYQKLVAHLPRQAASQAKP